MRRRGSRPHQATCSAPRRPLPTVENDGMANEIARNWRSSLDLQPRRRGLGLANVEARLAQPYGPAHELEPAWSGASRLRRLIE